MATIKLRYVKWRDGRPRGVHGPRERALGFKDADLRHGEGGPWFTFEQAQAWSDERAKAIAAQRQAPRPRKLRVAANRSIAELLKAWLASEEVCGNGSAEVPGLARNTQEGYADQVEAILWRPGRTAEQRATGAGEREKFSLSPVEAIGKVEAKEFFKHQRRVRGWHSALYSIACLRAAWSWGETAPAWRLGGNPFMRLKLPRPEGRIVIYTDAELRALIAAADAIGRHSIGDSIMLGLYSGQRQGDRLALVDDGLVDGRRQFRQSKTGAIVAIPETPALAARLEDAKKRVAQVVLRLGLGKDKLPATIIVDETTGRPYNKFTYRHVYAEVRELALKGSAERALAPCPSLAGKTDQDLRDTCVTWLARASSTIPEIASITGHSLQSITAILKHYLAITPELADSAIAKLVAWMDKKRMAV